MIRLCTICARGGSKGVKNKNIRQLLGKPLIAHTIQQAKTSQLFDSVAVSSESDAILDIAVKWGADFAIKRPEELATDTAPKLPCIRHCVIEMEYLTRKTYDIVVDLDVTSPLRNISDIQEAVSLLELEKAPNVITGTLARRSPYFNLVEIDANGVVRLSKPLSQPIIRRQDSPKCYDMNASIYVWQRQDLFDNDSLFNDNTRLYIMPEERSHDIDTELDFQIVEMLLNKSDV
jgi:N-acylneuraminate cytidylyltransferase/CMP-N,N'-diacetyllegionaminic acid synthase